MAIGRDLATGSVGHMIRRLLEFSPDVEMPAGIIDATSTPGVVSLIPPGPEREAVLAEVMADLEQRASQLDALATELRRLVARHDPMQLIPSIAVRASMGFLDPESADDAPHTFSTDAKIEYLAGLALAGPPGTEDVDETITRRAVALISSVFSAVQAGLVLQPPSEHAARHMGHESASFFLRLQYLYDRTAGYAVHLEEIGDEVFEPHRALYREELGFCPVGAGNSAVVVVLPRWGPMLSPRVPNLVPIPGPRMERETPGQRPRRNHGHPQVVGADQARCA